MRNATSFGRGQGGRPKGARNRIRREVRAAMQRLERDGDLDPARWFRRLQTIALGEDLGAAVAAARVLLEYRFGKPVAELEVGVQHELGPSVVELLEEIARSDRHRQALEEREKRRALAVTTTIVKEEVPS